MNIEFNAEWAQQTEPLTRTDLEAYLRVQHAYDEQIWHTRMKHLRLVPKRFCLKLLKKLLRLKFVPDWDQGEHGRHQVLRYCRHMRAGL